MSMIQSWLLNKGLSIPESTVMSLLEVESMAMLSQKLDVSLHQLHRFLDAPYKEALLHAQEGEIEQAIDHLKGAIANRPLHLPARLLHIQLLCLRKRYDAALENYWNLTKAFTYREDLVPRPLYEAFVNKLAHAPVLNRETQLRLRRQETDCQPRSVWCSPRGVAVEWASHSHLWWFHWDNVSVTVNSWDGQTLFSSVATTKTSLEMLTSDYVVYRNGADTFQVIDLATGTIESSLTGATYRALFLPPNGDLAAMQFYQLTHFTNNQLAAGQCAFSNVAFSLGRVEKEEEQDQILPAGDSEPTWTTTTVTLRWPTVDCLPTTPPSRSFAEARPRKGVDQSLLLQPEVVEVGWEGMD